MRCLRSSTSSRRRSSSSFDLNSAPRRGRERPHLFLSCLAMRRVVGAIIQHKVTHGSQIVQHQYSGVPALLTCNLSLGPAEHVNGYPSLLLMLAVAAAMVLHTLRYRSQVTTGLAFLLAFLTLTISQVTVYSLIAGVILALGLVVIVGRMQWFELEIFGIAAAYLNHWWWLRRIIEPMGAHKGMFPEFFASAGILLLYWTIFRVSYILRRCDERQEKVSTIAALLNSVGLLAL